MLVDKEDLYRTDGSELIIGKKLSLRRYRKLTHLFNTSIDRYRCRIKQAPTEIKTGANEN